MSADTAVRIAAVVPIKRLEHAKQRLAGVLTGEQRSALALAMLRDVLAALEASGALDEILVISPEPSLARHLDGTAVTFVPDTGYAGHSAAAEQGCARAAARHAGGILCLSADVPLVTAAQIRSLCARLRQGRALLLGADGDGTGTNLVALAPPGSFRFSFGPGSLRAHCREAARLGMTPEILACPEIALDVDTPECLALLRRRLEGQKVRSHTARYLSRLRVDGDGNGVRACAR